MNKMAMIAEQDLFDACHVLFGRQVQTSRSFLEYLQISGVKSAYRSKARETHPDMLGGGGEFAKRRGIELFQRVQEAYESLSSYLDARERGLVFFKTNCPTPKPASKAYQRRSNGASKSSSYASSHQEAKGGFRAGSTNWRWQQGAARYTTPSRQVPDRKLLFGHYLFYCGVTNWQTIIRALVWQRTERPRLGEIGKRFGWLTNSDIANILRQRNLTRSFGRAAVEMGLLTNRQLRLMVFQQNRLQKKIGEYFINNNLLSQYQLNRLVEKLRSHNTSVTATRRAS